MTERENLRRMLEGDRPHHLPLDVWLTDPSRDMMEAHLGTRDEVAALGLSIERVTPRYQTEPDEWREAYQSMGVPIGEHSVVGRLGTVDDPPLKHTVGTAYHLLEMRHPLENIETVAQLENLPWPDLHDQRTHAHLPEEVAAIHARGRASVGNMDCTMFEMAWYLRGMDRLYLDLVDGTGIADWLLDWFTHRAIVAVEHYVRAGVDLVWLGDDVGTQRGMMMAVDFWRAHLKPRLRRVTDAVRNNQRGHVWIAYHSDGDVRPIIEDLIEVGMDILNPVQPECMPIREVIPRYRDRMGFWGMVGTQSTMPFGAPDDVIRAVSELRDMARDGARIVVSPTHAIEPDVPWENLAALISEVKNPI